MFLILFLKFVLFSLKGDSSHGKHLLSKGFESVLFRHDEDSVFMPHQDQISPDNVMTTINCENVDKSLNCEVGVGQPDMASTEKVFAVVDGTLPTNSALPQPLVVCDIQTQSHSKFLFLFLCKI
jgi:hypothetical protein